MLSAKTKSQTGLLLATTLLLALSVLMVFSTTAVSSAELHGASTAFLNKHVIQLFLGVVVCFAFTRLSPWTIERYAFPLLVVSALLLLFVLGVGQSAGGATRWIGIGPLRFQPGELAKVAVVIYMSSYIGRHHHRMYSFVPGVIVPLGVVTLFAILLLAQPDFGTTSIILCVVFLQLLLVSRLTHLVSVGFGALCILGMLIAISPYRFRRVEAFMNPMNDASGSGYQLVQSLIAVGSGGLFGEGLGAGKQKLFYLPAAHTDFIFAVVAEELGLIGACGVVLLFLVFALSGYSIARRLSGEPFLCSLVVGLTSIVVVPAFLNMGVVLGILPTKGLVLPLVAYGGTAMVVNLAVVGILFRLAQLDDRE